ncbi:hypothetical protein ACFUN8_29950 [Streptomyces sp. NPDC057307]|uniref:hypothetical protein n=1 Tax=Streptomyces sp. NPDC057307 TaxID=3346096 RepID=UPI003626EC3F
MDDRDGQDGQGDRHAAEIGQELRESDGATSEGRTPQALVGVTERATGDDLPGDEREENRAESERPERGERSDGAEEAG